MLQEEKSEDGEVPFMVDEPSFLDSEGLADVSVTAKQAPVMADVSEHTLKKKAKRKKKKQSKSRGHCKSSAIIEDTDPETSDNLKRPPRQRKKTKRRTGDESQGMSRSRSRSSKRVDYSNGHENENAVRKSRSKKERRKSSKKRRERKEPKENGARIEAAEIGEDGDKRESTENKNAVDQNEAGPGQPSYLPPELNSDSSSSYIPDPSDLEAEDEYESASTCSSIERDTNQKSLLPISLLGNKPQDPEPDTVELEVSSSSFQPLSAPPQLIPGSLANGMLSSRSVDVADVKRHFLRPQFDLKCKAIVAMAVLLAASIAIIIVLATKGEEESKVEAQFIIPSMLTKWEITMYPYTASHAPDAFAQKEWTASTASYLQNMFVEDFEGALSLESLDALTFQHSFASGSTLSALNVELILMISSSSSPPLEDFEFIARRAIQSLGGNENYLSEIIDLDLVFASIEEVQVQERILAPTDLDECTSGLKEVDEDENERFSLTEYIDFLSRDRVCDVEITLQESNIERMFNGFNFIETDGTDQVIDLATLTRNELRRLCVVSSELVSYCPTWQTSSPSSSPTAAEICPFGLFFLGSDAFERLYSMDRFDRGVFLWGSSSFRNISGLSGLAYDSRARQLFASRSGPTFDVFELDPATGENRGTIDAATRQAGSLSAIEIVDGSIYGITDSMELYTITPTSAPMRVGQLNVAEPITDLAWTGSTLYGITSSGLYTIVEETGQATVLCRLWLANYSSLVYFSPEELLYGGLMDGSIVEIDPNECSETKAWNTFVSVMELTVVCRESSAD